MKKETLRLEWWNPEDLTENPRNWRRHPPAQAAALRQMLAEVGWAEKIPVLVGNWTEDQELKILLTLDPIASMASASTACDRWQKKSSLKQTILALMGCVLVGAARALRVEVQQQLRHRRKKNQHLPIRLTFPPDENCPAGWEEVVALRTASLCCNLQRGRAGCMSRVSLEMHVLNAARAVLPRRVGFHFSSRLDAPAVIPSLVSIQ